METLLVTIADLAGGFVTIPLRATDLPAFGFFLPNDVANGANRIDGELEATGRHL